MALKKIKKDKNFFDLILTLNKKEEPEMLETTPVTETENQDME
jgi:hypothetical protein